jgi:hypothetical protein
MTPLLFVSVTGWTIWHSIAERPAIVAAGLATLAAGALLYLWCDREVAEY